MPDLTIIYITANEMPSRWQAYHIKHLLHAANEYPIITVSRKPLSIGENIIDAEPKSYWNIYMQMLRAARMAHTEYVAMAEDDVLYTREHFKQYRPKNDAVSYDRSRWSLFAWDAIYCLRQRVSNCSLIAPRRYLIEALEERKQKHPGGLLNSECGEVGRERIEKRIGVTIRKAEEWWCSNPIVQLNHPTGSEDLQKKKWKRHGQIKANRIPYWGEAERIVSYYAE